MRSKPTNEPFIHGSVTKTETKMVSVSFPGAKPEATAPAAAAECELPTDLVSYVLHPFAAFVVSHRFIGSAYDTAAKRLKEVLERKAVPASEVDDDDLLKPLPKAEIDAAWKEMCEKHIEPSLLFRLARHVKECGACRRAFEGFQVDEQETATPDLVWMGRDGLSVGRLIAEGIMLHLGMDALDFRKRDPLVAIACRVIEQFIPPPSQVADLRAKLEAAERERDEALETNKALAFTRKLYQEHDAMLEALRGKAHRRSYTEERCDKCGRPYPQYVFERLGRMLPPAGPIAQLAAAESALTTAQARIAELSHLLTVERQFHEATSEAREAAERLAIDAWGIIANASAGFWENEPSDWQAAAKRWREDYHKWLDTLPEPETEDAAT